MRRRSLLALAVAALLVSSGCTALQSTGNDDQPSPPDVDVEQRYESLRTLNATQASTIDYNGTTNETRVSVLADFTTDPPRQYQRVLAPDDRAGDVTVVNESGSLLYDAGENSVTRVPRSDSASSNTRDREDWLANVVAAARDGDVAEAENGVSPLPVVPAASNAPRIPADAIDGFEVEYLGTDTVAGRTAHGFELTAASEAALAVNQTLWLDSEYFYPLKTHQTMDLRNRTVESTSTLTDVTFNGDLPEDAFAFDVPEDATVETLNLSAETFDSVEALRAAANFTIPEPAVPDGYEFEQARLMDGNATQAALQYADGSDQLTVTKMNYTSNQSSTLTSGENVTVAGRDGRYLTTGQSSLLSWSCEDTQYSVIATDLGKEELLAIAESVACR